MPDNGPQEVGVHKKSRVYTRPYSVRYKNMNAERIQLDQVIYLIQGDFIGERLSERKLAPLLSEWLPRRISQPTLNAWLTGRTKIPLDHMAALIEAEKILNKLPLRSGSDPLDIASYKAEIVNSTHLSI